MTDSTRNYYTANNLYYTETMSYEDFDKLKKSSRFKDILRYDMSTTNEIVTVRFKEREELIEDVIVATHNKTKIIMYCAIFFTVLAIISMITTFVITAKVSKTVSAFDSIANYQKDSNY